MICDTLSVDRGVITQNHLPSEHFDLTTFKSSSDLYPDVVDDIDLDTDWMSVNSIDRRDSEQWMPHIQNANHYANFLSSDPDHPAYNQRSAGSNDRSWSQAYNGGFSPYSVTQTPPQSKPHRRALSTSTASTSSPAHSSSGYPPALFDSNQYRHLQTQYYPTPTHTPTSGSFMEPGYGSGSAAPGPQQPQQTQMKPYSQQPQGSGPQYPQHPQQQPQHGRPIYPSSNMGAPTAPTPHSANAPGDQRYPGHPSPAHYQQHHQQQQHPPPNQLRPLAPHQPQPHYPQQQPQQQQYGQPNNKMPPHLQHSITQICADEGYNPIMGPQSQHAQQNPSNFLMPDHMSEYLRAANEQRQNQPNAPADSLKREPSPYRPGSQFAHEQDLSYMQHGQASTAAQQREQQRRQDNAYQYWRHHTRGEDPSRKADTISPKDAYLDDFKESAEEPGNGNIPLFPARTNSSTQQQMYADDSQRHSYGPINGHRTMPTPQSSFSFQTPGMPASANSHSYAPLIRQDSSSDDVPAHLVSMETSRSEPESSQEAQSARLPPRPIDSGYGTNNNGMGHSRPSSGSISTADTGTYSCTYIGCPQRFPTPMLLQKHKKEAHRPPPGSSNRHSAAPTGASSPSTARPGSDSPGAAPGSAGSAAMSQAGPHRCDRINPSTGKSCNTVFSRPYDLTRHEDTIHARRPKVHCQFCQARGEEKTFSRADALTRHLRVVHPDVDVRGFAGRRRGLA